MSNLFVDSIKYLKIKIASTFKYRKLQKREKDYNQHIIDLGKMFQQLGLEHEKSEKLLQEIKDIDNSINQVTEKVNHIESTKKQEEEAFEKVKEEYENKYQVVYKDFKIKEEEYLSVKDKYNNIVLDIQKIEKNIKTNIHDMKQLDKKIKRLNSKPYNVNEAVLEDISLFEVEMRNKENSIDEMKKEIQTKNDELNKVGEELSPIQKEHQEIEKMVNMIQSEWKEVKQQHDKKMLNYQEEIENEKGVIAEYESQKVIPFSHLGQIALEDKIEDESLKKMITKLTTENQKIELLKAKVVQNEAFLRHPETKKLRNLIIYWAIFLVLLISLIIVLFGKL